VVIGLCASIVLALPRQSGAAESLPIASSPSIQSNDFFEQKIRPVLVERCYECHSAERGKTKGGLRVDSPEGLRNGGDGGAVLVPGDPDKSRLVRAIRYQD